MALGTAIKKNRWFRLAAKPPEIAEIDNLLNLYWGGPERRITGLTLRIIGVNAIALVILLLGILYLGQYQNGLIEARLETFETEVTLISAAISEDAIEESSFGTFLNHEKAIGMAKRLSQSASKQIRIFDADGQRLGDSFEGLSPEEIRYIEEAGYNSRQLPESIKVLKNMAGFIIGLLPDRRVLPYYPETTSDKAADYPNVPDALSGQVSLSAWYDSRDKIFLSAASPLHQGNTIAGAILITRTGQDIEDDIGGVWLDILRIFAATLVITTLLSIYLSGVIARPLKKLASAAEDVRRGKGGEIPDLSHRHDEIGELSIVLRDMTNALWDRMDSIENFAADVAHELKNPLTSLRSAIETAFIVKSQTDRERLQKVILHDLDRVNRLISDISRASRLDAELSREAFGTIDLTAALSALFDAYKTPLERSKERSMGEVDIIKIDETELRLNMPKDTAIHVWGLETRLVQVFENLISNAVSFSPEGGVVQIGVSLQGPLIRITVEDEGPGIPENRLDTIFERFYSERPQHEDYGHHSGLGLSICRQIITAHQGRIFAENIKDGTGNVKGARFVVILNSL